MTSVVGLLGSFSATLVTSGLLVQLDASNSSSYSGSGSTWNDISGNSRNGTITGTIPYVSSGQASYFNFATASDSNYIANTTAISYVDFTAVIYPDFTRVGGANLAGLIGTNTSGSNADKSLRFNAVNGTGPWGFQNGGDANDWAYPGTTFYVNNTASNTLVSGWNIIGGYRTNQTTYPLSSAWYIGSSAYGSRSYQGRLAFLALYNRQLSAAEQTQNFSALRGRFGR